MAAGCAALLSPLSPLCLQPLNPVLSARVFHALARLLTGSWGDGCLVSKHHPSQAWRKRSPLQHPWRKGNTAASLEEGEPFAASLEEREPFAVSLEMTTFAEARSPPPCTRGLVATSLLRQGFHCPAERMKMLLRATSPSYRQRNPQCQTPSGREEFWLRGG